METMHLDRVLEEIRASLERGELDRAARILESYRPADQESLFSDLDERQQIALLPQLDPEDSADIMEELDDARAAELAEQLPDRTVARIVDEMEPDEAADLLGDIRSERAEKILSRLEDADEIRPLLLHPDESAGGLMTSDFMVLRRKMTVEAAIQALRRWRPDSESIYYLFVADAAGRLRGVVSLRGLVVAPPEALIEEIMNPDVISVGQNADQEEVARLMSRYDLLALPVVDESDVLLGVVTVDDAIDVMQQEATEDIQRLGGAEPLERSYFDTSPLGIMRKRLGWLLLLFLTATLTGSVIRLFEDEIRMVAALVVFIPLLIGTGGNAGSQTTATIIRSLATGEIGPREFLRVWWHEARVAVLLGSAMAVAGFLCAVAWDADTTLALTVAVSTACLIFWAASVGALLPLAAAQLGFDPALVSGPVMSTLVDATGLLIYFSIARLILGL